MNTTEQPHIHVKSYFASTIPDAIEVAREELGADALLLNSRTAPPEAQHLGALEVVFGVYAQKSGAPQPTAATASVDDLRDKMDEIRRLLVRSTAGSGFGRVPLVRQVLVDAGLTQAIASDIEASVAVRLSRRPVLEISRGRKPQGWDPDSILQETVADLESRFTVKPELGRITVLAGPPGAGKTTTLVKLAVNEGLLKRRSVCLISADTQRIGAAEQLRSYAAILGVPFESAQTSAALERAIDRASADLVLVDTPGLGPALFESNGTDLASMIARRQDIDTHLVLTASTRPDDLETTARRFEAFRPAALIFTGLDLATSTGAAASEAIRSGKPVSWLCGGQLVPEDIEPASIQRIARELVHELPELLRSAA
jgi:flagellar biosynthesis protein FlhF